MSALSKKWRRLREAAAVARYGASTGDALALFACYLRLLVRPPGTAEQVVTLRLGDLVHRVTFRERDIFTFGEILFEQQYRLPPRLPAGAVVLDAGANIGIMALLLRSQYPEAELHVFEPFPDNARLLRVNLSGLPRTHVHELALGDTDGTAMLHGGDHDAEHSLVDTSGGGADIAVRVARLDGWLAAQGNARVALLKVDVEGSEQALVDGLGERVADVDVIVGEFHETMVDESRFYGALTAAGFTLRHRDRALDGGPVHMFRLDRAGTA